LMVIEVDEPLAARAGGLVRALPLRGADATHLASAQSLPQEAELVKFVCWDRRLWDAARAVALQVVPELPP
jgi:predicted nucleic acid-binding protein